MNNKGISPLIATVLIVGFTIVLTVVVVNWSRTIIDETTGEVGCETSANSICRNMPKIPISLSKIEDVDPLLTNQTKILISNVYNKDLEFLLVFRNSTTELISTKSISLIANEIYDNTDSSNPNFDTNFELYQTYYSGNYLQYSLILPHTDEQNNQCKVTCKQEEITIK